MNPRRIQRRRTKGWRMPENAVYVGRGSKWGNPYRVNRKLWVELNGMDVIYGPAAWPQHAEAVAVERYKNALMKGWHGLDMSLLGELCGKDLACWCGPGHRCHADVLLDLANQTQP